MEKVMDSEQVRTGLERLYEAILPALPPDVPIAVVGIRTRGMTIADRIAERLRRDKGLEVRRGALDITFYRDDLSRRRGAPLVRATEIDFDLDETWVLLIDDVLQTGRSVRAALDALHDFGRPRTVRLGVLIDRGGREVPVAADFVGHRLETGPEMRVQVRLKENDGEEGVYIVKKEA